MNSSSEKSEPAEFYFRPGEEVKTNLSAEAVRKLGLVPPKEEKLRKLSDFARDILKQIEGIKVETWEVSVEGTLEAGGGFFPGKLGFKATLTLSNKKG